MAEYNRTPKLNTMKKKLLFILRSITLDVKHNFNNYKKSSRSLGPQCSGSCHVEVLLTILKKEDRHQRTHRSEYRVCLGLKSNKRIPCAYLVAKANLLPCHPICEKYVKLNENCINGSIDQQIVIICDSFCIWIVFWSCMRILTISGFCPQSEQPWWYYRCQMLLANEVVCQ